VLPVLRPLQPGDQRAKARVVPKRAHIGRPQDAPRRPDAAGAGELIERTVDECVCGVEIAQQNEIGAQPLDSLNAEGTPRGPGLEKPQCGGPVTCTARSVGTAAHSVLPVGSVTLYALFKDNPQLALIANAMGGCQAAALRSPVEGVFPRAPRSARKHLN